MQMDAIPFNSKHKKLPPITGDSFCGHMHISLFYRMRYDRVSVGSSGSRW
jgi:hypothetical protein